MKVLLAIAALVAMSVAYPQFGNIPRPVIPITSYSSDSLPDGSYSYSYSTGNGISQQARGYVKNAGVKDAEVNVVEGSYAYTAPDGTPIHLSYYADETGFHAVGDHLPVPPPIPAAIQRSLDYIAHQPKRVTPTFGRF